MLTEQIHSMGLTHFWEDHPVPKRPIVITGKRQLFEVIRDVNLSRWTFYDCTWWAYIDELTPSQISKIKREMHYPDLETFKELTEHTNQ